MYFFLCIFLFDLLEIGDGLLLYIDLMIIFFLARFILPVCFLLHSFLYYLSYAFFLFLFILIVLYSYFLSLNFSFNSVSLFYDLIILLPISFLLYKLSLMLVPSFCLQLRSSAHAWRQILCIYLSLL